MAHSHTVVHTTQGKKLVTRLGRHWGHKFDVILTDTQLTVPFNPEAQALLRVKEEALEIELRHSQADELATLQQVVAEHLQRFAGEETLQFNWRR